MDIQVIVVKRHLTLLGLLLSMSSAAMASGTTTAFMNWDSHYVTEGRNNLSDGGIVWTGVEYSRNNWTLYEQQGFADHEDYIELNVGMSFDLSLPAYFVLSPGYQRLEFFANERCHDNELFAGLAYTGFDPLVPELAYTYATEADGGFLEFSLSGSWPISRQMTLSPYVLQSWDFGYATAEVHGRNHFQFGVELAYELTPKFNMALQLNRSIGQSDIKRENERDHSIDDENQTFGGLSFSWTF